MNEHVRPSAINLDISDVQARFLDVLERAANGQTVHITKSGKPYAKLGPERESGATKERLSRVGAFDGQFELPENWDQIPTGFEKYT